MAEGKDSPVMRWMPLALGVATIVALLAALGARGAAAMWFLVLFVALLPAALAATLIRWWPGGHHDTAGIDWRRNLTLGGAGLLLAAVLTLLLGVGWTGARLGNMLLVAGALLLPPAALVAALGWLLGRGSRLERELATDEQAVYHAREHWGVLLPPAAVLVLAALLAIAPLGVVGYGAAAVLYLLVLPATGVNALSAWLHTRFVLTSDQLLLEQGLFRRRVRRLPLASIDGCGIQQNWLGRLLGFGKLSLIFSDGSSLAVRGIADPHALRQRIMAHKRTG